MAAGLGSRFGGPKQLEPVGPSGETLIDYALFDAWRAGFERAALVVRREIAAAIERLAERHRGRMDVSLAHQQTGPRIPRGTVPAVLAAADSIDGPFAALNADDFYGAASYRIASDFLRDPAAADTHGVVALPLTATLSSHGGVTRAICQANEDGALIRLEEVRGLVRRGEAVMAGDRRFTGTEHVSMNFWAFRRNMIDELSAEFEQFARSHDSRHELLLPVIVDALIAAGRARVRVLPAPGPWLGLTHADDLPAVRAALCDLVGRGVYPTPVWD